MPVSLSTAAYAGIPLTYPGGGDTLTFRARPRGQGRKTAARAWAHLAKLEGTVCCYGGRTELMASRPGLLEHGRAGGGAGGTGAARHPRRPADDRRPLAEVVARLEDGLDGPATLVIGKVVGLRDHLRWFDQRPLFGRRVLVTRSREQRWRARGAARRRRRRGDQAPVLRIGPPTDPGPLERAAASARW